MSTITFEILGASPTGGALTPAGVGFSADDNNRPYLTFDNATQQYAVWTTRVPGPDDYGSNPVMKVQVSNSVVGLNSFVVDCMLIAVDGDIQTGSFTQFGTGTATTTVINGMKEASFALNELTAGSYLALRLSRTTAGQAASLSRVWAAAIEYTSA